MKISVKELKKIIRKEIKLLMEVPLVGHEGEIENQVYDYETLKAHLKDTKTKYHVIYINDKEFNLIPLIAEDDDFNTFAYASRTNILSKDVKEIGGINIESIPEDRKIIVINKNAFTGQAPLKAILTKYFDHDLGHTTVDLKTEQEIVQFLRDLKNDLISFSMIVDKEHRKNLEFSLNGRKNLEKAIIEVFLGPNVYDQEFGLEDQTANFAFSIIKMIDSNTFNKKNVEDRIRNINLDLLLQKIKEEIPNIEFKFYSRERIVATIEEIKNHLKVLLSTIENIFINTDYISFVGFN